jgi:hypothetical protein
MVLYFTHMTADDYSFMTTRPQAAGSGKTPGSVETPKAENANGHERLGCAYIRRHLNRNRGRPSNGALAGINATIEYIGAVVLLCKTNRSDCLKYR